MSSVWVALAAGVLTTLVIYVARPLAIRIGLTDRPGDRKTHKGDIPLVGGVAIYVAFVVSSILFDFADRYMALLAGGAVLVTTGALDDRVQISPKMRLCGQVAAALVMCLGGGVVVHDLGAVLLPGEKLELHFAAVPFTVFCTVALINAVNMSDGVDGLAGGQSFLSLGGLATALAVTGALDQSLPLLALCGSLLAFLAFNIRTPLRRRAAIFLGDAGSTFLGYALAWFLIQLSQGPNSALLPTAMLWFVMLQVFDTVQIVVRRMMRGRSPLAADREHLHHILLLAGFTASSAVCVMLLVSSVGVAVGLLANLLHPAESLVFACFAICAFLFLSMIMRTWKTLRLGRRSICRRKMDRRSASASLWRGPERRSGHDRRSNTVRNPSSRPRAVAQERAFKRQLDGGKS